MVQSWRSQPLFLFARHSLPPIHPRVGPSPPSQPTPTCVSISQLHFCSSLIILLFVQTSSALRPASYNLVEGRASSLTSSSLYHFHKGPFTSPTHPSFSPAGHHPRSPHSLIHGPFIFLSAWILSENSQSFTLEFQPIYSLMSPRLEDSASPSFPFVTRCLAYSYWFSSSPVIAFQLLSHNFSQNSYYFSSSIPLFSLFLASFFYFLFGARHL